MAKKYEDDIKFEDEDKVSTKKSSQKKYEDDIKFEDEEAPLPTQAVEYLTKNFNAETLQDAAVSAAQGSTPFADELYGAGKSIMESGGGSGKAPLEMAPQYTEEAREAYKVARERSPVASTISELGAAALTPDPFSKITKIGKYFKPLTGAVEGLIQGIGATEEDKLSAEGMGEAAIGGAIGLGTGAASRSLRNYFQKSPSTLRANVLGAGAKELKDRGVRSRKKIADEMKELGLFSNRKVKFDINKEKFVPVSKGKFTIDEMDKAVPDRLQSRVEDALEQINEEKKRFFSVMGKRTVSPSEIEKALDMATDEYARLRVGYGKRLEKGSKIKESIIEDMRTYAREQGRDNLTLQDLDNMKKVIYSEAGDYGTNTLLKDIPDLDELYQKMARGVKELEEKYAADPQFKRINSLQQRFLTTKADLKNKIASIEGSGAKSVSGMQGSMVDRGLRSIMGGEEGDLFRADVSEFLNKNPKLRKGLGETSKEVLPMIYRRQIQPTEGVQVPYRPDQSYFRKNIPEELIRTKLPRSTDKILSQKPFFQAKIAQQAPELYDSFMDALNNDPEHFQLMVKELAKNKPEMFERDEFNLFDGNFVSNIDRMAVKKKIVKDKRMSSLDRARAVSELLKKEV